MTANPSTFRSERAGVLRSAQRGADGFAAFIPAPLPPDPPVILTPHLIERYETAAMNLGRVDGVSLGFDVDRLLYMYVRKEAVLSSEIEGTQSTPH